MTHPRWLECIRFGQSWRVSTHLLLGLSLVTCNCTLLLWQSWHKGGWWLPGMAALQGFCAAMLAYRWRQQRAWEKAHGAS